MYDYCNSYVNFHLSFLIYAWLVEFCWLWTDFEVGIFLWFHLGNWFEHGLLLYWEFFVDYISIFSLNHSTVPLIFEPIESCTKWVYVYWFIYFFSFFSGYTLFWDFFFLAIFSVYMSFLWSCWDPSFPKPGQHGMEELLHNYVPFVYGFHLFLAHRHPWEGLDSMFFGSFYVLHLTFFIFSIYCSVSLVWRYDIVNGLVFGIGEVRLWREMNSMKVFFFFFFVVIPVL